MTDLPRVVIVGRQNVGKSTLVNRLFGRRQVIAHEQPGVTRDRVEVPVEWRGRSFLVVDTGGYTTRAGGVEALASAQAARATETADLVLLVADAQTGIQEEDAMLARRMRKARVPVLAVVNKVDSEVQEPDAAAFHALGLGEPITVSLFNRLVEEERSVVYEEAGTTRDAVDAVVSWESGPVRFVDTAGLRRAARMQGVDYYGLVRAAQAIDRAHVALLVLDATEGLTGDDKHVAARIIESGRGMVVAANKWDLVPSGERSVLLEDLAEELSPFHRPPLARTSALSGQGVARLPGLLLEQHARWARRVPTAEVNRVLQEAQGERPPPRGTPRFRYGTQTSAGPPTFVLFGARAPEPGYRRFLENRLRRAFGLDGIPVRLKFRAKRRR